jgi:phage terminase small subunit
MYIVADPQYETQPESYEELDPIPGLCVALATAWGERAHDKAIYAIAAALMADEDRLLELFRHGYGTFKWFVEQGYRVEKAMEKKDLTDPIYRPAHLEAQWKRHVVRAQQSVKPIDEASNHRRNDIDRHSGNRITRRIWLTRDIRRLNSSLREGWAAFCLRESYGRSRAQAQEPQEIKLTPMQRKFVDAYVGESRANAARAARMAGYSEKTARQQGQRLLTNVDIQEAISERASEYAMSPEQVLAELRDIALNANISTFLHDDEGALSFQLRTPSGEYKPEVRLLKKVSVKGGLNPSISIEVYDRVAALTQIGKFHGMWIEKTALTDPTGQHEYGEQSDQKRIDAIADRFMELLDTARARRDAHIVEAGRDLDPDTGASDEGSSQ